MQSNSSDGARGEPLDWVPVALYYIVITLIYLPWLFLADNKLTVILVYLITAIVLVLPYKYFLRRRGYDVDPRKYRWWDYKDRSRPR
jgi:hypothetical protein